MTTKKLTIKQFIERSQKVHGDKYNYSKFIYINSHTKGIIICKKHGEFLQMPYVHLGGQNCPICRYIQSKKTYISNKIIKEGSLISNNPELCKEWDYDKNYPLTPDEVTCGSSKKVWWICFKNKEHKWKTIISHRSNGSGCPYCNIWSQQEKVREIFKQLFKVKFEKKRFYFTNIFNIDKRRRICMEFDGYNSDLKIAFEYNGKQHYKYPNAFHRNKLQFQKLRSYDLFKQKFCKEHNIKLFIVPYWIKEKEFENYIKSKI